MCCDGQCRGSRSSLHYDPFHNLLCVVSGSKTVRCLSPEATKWVYPQPVYGESPNHSQVNFADPDLNQHPLYAKALQHVLTAELQVVNHLLGACSRIFAAQTCAGWDPTRSDSSVLSLRNEICEGLKSKVSIYLLLAFSRSCAGK